MPVITFSWKPKKTGIPFYSPNPAAIAPIGFLGSGSITISSASQTDIAPISFASELVNVFENNTSTLVPISFASELVIVFESNFSTLAPISFAGSL
jgi:hypothetical protein